MNSKILVTLFVLLTGQLFSQIPATVLGQKYFLSTSFQIYKGGYTKVSSLSFKEDSRESKRLGTTEVPIEVTFIQDLKEYFLNIFSIGNGYYISADEEDVQLYFFSPDGKIYLICPGESLDALEHYCVISTDKKAVKEISQEKIKDEVLAVVKGYKDFVMKKYKSDGNLVLYKTGVAPAAPTVSAESKFSVDDEAIHGRVFIQNPNEKIYRLNNESCLLPCYLTALDKYLRLIFTDGEFHIRVNNLSTYSTKQIDFDFKTDSKTINYMEFLTSSYSSYWQSRLGTGIHTCILSVRGQDESKIATAVFDLDHKALKDRFVFEALYNETEIKKNYPKFRKIPLHYFAQKGKFTDPQLSVESIKKMVMDADDNIASVNKVFIGNTGADWAVYKNDLGAIVSKYSNRTIWVSVKKNDGSCFLVPIDIIRLYSGGGSYEAPYAKLDKFYPISSTELK